MKIKFKTAREKNLASVVAVIGLLYVANTINGILGANLLTANRSPIIGNHTVNVDTSELVDVDELPLFASMSGNGAGNEDGLINSDIFSRPAQEEAEVEEVVLVEIPSDAAEAPRPDIGALVHEQFFLSAVIHDGAVINNVYHRIGDPLRNKLETGRSEHEVILASANKDQAILRVEGVQVILRLP